MPVILGIETSCDETAAAVYDSTTKRLLSDKVFSQIKLHEIYGGVVPEIASRSHLEKIDIIVEQALEQAGRSLDEIDVVAVTSKPGLVGSLLIGLCFAKSIAWSKNKKIIGIDHLESHVFSSFLNDDFTINEKVDFPHLCLSVSGGHTALYLVEDFGKYSILGQTLDDAAGEAFDKIAKVIGLPYPGGAKIEQLAKQVDYQDFFSYPRSKRLAKDLKFSFSGLKTAVLYDLVKRGAYNLQTGPIKEKIDIDLQQKVSSSLLVCIKDVFCDVLKNAFKRYPDINGFAFVGGVACNKYLKKELKALSEQNNKWFISPSCRFCGDNAAMVAFTGGSKTDRNQFSDLSLDVLE